MKRSTQVTLVLMGAIGIGGTAYALSSSCPQLPPGADPAQQTCRSGHGGHWFHSGSSGATYFGSTGGTPATGSSAPAVTTSRGGFGGSGRAVASAGT